MLSVKQADNSSCSAALRCRSNRYFSLTNLSDKTGINAVYCYLYCFFCGFTDLLKWVITDKVRGDRKSALPPHNHTTWPASDMGRGQIRKQGRNAYLPFSQCCLISLVVTAHESLTPNLQTVLNNYCHWPSHWTLAALHIHNLNFCSTSNLQAIWLETKQWIGKNQFQFPDWVKVWLTVTYCQAEWACSEN